MGVETSFTEYLTLGWAMYYFNRRAFVFTTERILLIQVGGRNKPMELRAQVRYPAIAQVKSSALGGLRIKFRDKGTVVFGGMPRRDRKFVQTLIQGLRGAVRVSPTGPWGAENLCPFCYVAVDGFPAGCAGCGKPFKSPRRAAWLSFLFPGFGDFYLGHRAFASFEVLAAGLVWLTFFLPPEQGVDPAAVAEPVPLEGWIIAIAIVFLIMHGLDAIFTRRIARKGVYPG